MAGRRLTENKSSEVPRSINRVQQFLVFCQVNADQKRPVFHRLVQVPKLLVFHRFVQVR